MKFFFPDSQDQIDPDFDFTTEEHSIHRVRQRDDLYAHEALSSRSYDGILVSKTIVDGTPYSAGKYTQAQRHRLYRVGVQRFFRLDAACRPKASMGDCGAFSYVRDDTPPYSPDEVIDFYEQCGFDLGVSVDHVILGFDTRRTQEKTKAWRDRQDLTLQLAAEFLERCRKRDVRFKPMGVAQGWSPSSYARAVSELQTMGYTRVALGGMVPLKTPEILGCLRAINDVREPSTRFHLLGVTRVEQIGRFAEYGVTSFDSTSPFRQAFKDDRDNYYAVDRTYTAVRVPQVDGNAKLKAAIRAGQLDQAETLDLERTCLRLLHAYDHGDTKLEGVLDALARYSEHIREVSKDKRSTDRTDVYREILENRPWKTCTCGICEASGINVAIFRGSERNKRRGFHNLYVFARRLESELDGTSP
jgi:hypothetical protein